MKTYYADVWQRVIEQLEHFFSSDAIDVGFRRMQIGAIEHTYAILFTDIKDNLEFLRSETRTIERAFDKAYGEFKVIYIYHSSQMNYLAQLKRDAEFDMVYPAPPGEDIYLRPSPRSEMEMGEGFEPNASAEDFVNRYLKKVSGTRSEEEDIEFHEKMKDVKTDLSDLNINLDYTFDSFIVSSSNKFAYNAAMAVATNPSTAWNPLFIYGPSGLGKTHLLYAIVNETIKNHPGIKMVFSRGEDFTVQLVESLREKDGPTKFRNKFRKLDVLLIDDIQFIAGKEGVQEEFFHTFNSLYDEHKQIIMTSDRPPRDIPLLQERLKNRYEMGLTADVQPPDYELRAAVIESKARDYGMELPKDVITYLADSLNKNIRQIEGSLKRIAAKSTLYGMPITLDMAKRTISDIANVDASPKAVIEKIFSAVSAKYGVTENEIKSKSRRREITNARHVSIYFIRKFTGYSLKQIANIFGRDHTTIMSSLEGTEQKIVQEPFFEREIIELETDIKDFH